MRKITDFIVEKRYFILTSFILITILCIGIMSKVNINYDISKYLPNNSETKTGMNIMDKEFDSKSSSFNLMFKGLSNEEKNKIYDELTNINHVSSVLYDSSSNYNKDDYTLYVINIDDKDDSETSSTVYKDIMKKYEDYKTTTSGSVASHNKPVLHMWIVAIAIMFAMVILIIMCDSYTHPFLILFTVGLAVFINKGTNIIFPSVSHITNSIVAILQMALSMDYAIMLINRYDQEKIKNKNNVEAMKEALSKSFSSIASSSVTTIVGLLALVFMSFTIGKDLGFVLAKGVLLSLICILFCLPSLLLIFDKLISRTKKKVFSPKLHRLGKFEYLIRHISIPVFLLLFVGCYFLKGNLGILYTDTEMDDVAKVFTLQNQMAIIYKNEDEDKISKYCSLLENNKDVEQVLCYGNTIGQKLTYDELIDKLDSLGVNVDIDNNLLKILYYNYFNKTEEKITFKEFINFIYNQVYSNEEISKKLDNNSKSNLEKLNYFIQENEYNKKRNSKELSYILNINKNKIDKLLIYYNSKNINNKLTVGKFINFVNNNVLTNKEYSKEIDKNSINDLNKLSKFTNKNIINNKLSYKEMAKLFDLDEDMTNSLYTYYLINNNIDTKLSINEFIDFILNDVSKDSRYSNYISNDKLNSLKELKTFTNKNFISKNMNIKTLSSIFNMDEDSTRGILFLYYSTLENNNSYSLLELLNYINYIKNNTNYLDNIDLSNFTKLELFIKNNNNINNTKLDKENLSNIFNNVSNGLVDKVYYSMNLSDDYLLTPSEFVDLVINNMSSYMDNDSLNKIKVLKFVIDDSNNPKKYNTSYISKLGIDKKRANELYTLIDYITKNTNNWNVSPYRFVNIILSNKDNNLISNKLNKDILYKLNLLNNVMKSTINNTKYNYNDLSKILNIDSSLTKKIYSIYVNNNTTYKIFPKTFINFILNHKNDSILKDKLDSNMINKLNILNKVIYSTNNNVKYSSNDLSKLLSIDKNKIDLLYSLYSYNDNYKISLKSFIKFIKFDVMNEKKYSSNFDDESKNKINTIYGIINASSNNTKYSKDEIFIILSNLNDSINQKTINLLFIYYGSQNNYNKEWKLTVEEFVNYLNNDIINNKNFSDFIKDEMKDKIKNSKSKLDDSKKLLVGNNYSRVVINTRLEPEGKNTFNFINEVKDNIKSDVNDFYFIGNSPMALEMNNSFSSELDFITILTMVAIFIAVAFTFKSIIIPTILVIIIQSAVYLTMGILSISGGSVYFIALLIVQSILMGATIDYAIVYTSYYLESRNTLSIKESIINSYDKSIHTILTSASILIIVTLIVGNFASAIAAKICKTLSEGTLCSLILILTLLPAILAICDKIIVKKK